MKHLREVFVAMIGLNLVACANHEVKPQVTFNSSEYTEYLATGNGRINGSAYVKKTRGGQVTCAGSSVFLLPKTPYFTEVVEHAKANSKTEYTPEVMQQVKEVIRFTRCDVEGKFQFQNLPSGNWYVMTRVVLDKFPNQERRGLIREVISRSNQNLELTVAESDE